MNRYPLRGSVRRSIKKGNGSDTVKKLLNLTAFLIITAGLILLAYPYLRMWRVRKNAETVIEDFRQRAALAEYGNWDKTDIEKNIPYTDTDDIPEQKSETHSDTRDETASAEKSQDERPLNSLYIRMAEYNNDLFLSRQSELKDVFSYSDTDLLLTDFGLPDEICGIITIKKMGIELPLYIGANRANMKKGAAIMNRTSLPLGQKNSNCVIAAHRMSGFFGKIELLKINDEIKITNLWEELTYKVVKIIVIDPYDTEKIKIIPDKDMITLLTCHPYGKNTKRYVVYCERESGSDANSTTADSNGSELSGQEKLPLDSARNNTSVPDDPDTISGSDETAANSFSGNGDPQSTSEILPDGMEYESSQTLIYAEHIVRIGGIIATFLFLMIILISGMIRSKK